MTESAPPGTARQFDARLESLRGIAAFAVVTCHALSPLRIRDLMLPLGEQPAAALLINLVSAVLNVDAAVTLFFVLSGFVLTLALSGGIGVPQLRAYLIRRAFRLLPPLWFSVGAMALMLYAVRPDDLAAFTDLFAISFRPEPGLRRIVGNLVLAGYTVNGVTWSLYVEVIGSLFVPLSLLVRSHLGLPGAWALTAMLIAVTFLAYPSFTLCYVICFQCGVMLALHRPSLGRGASILLVLIAEAVFVFDELALSSSPYRVLLVSAAASLMICGVINGAAQNLLLAPPLRFLGRISYSLYLLHLIPVYLISIALVDFGLPYDKLSSQLLDLALTIPSSIALAAFGYWAIERPSIRAGRHVAARLPEAWRQRRFTPPESRRAAPEMPEEDAKARTLRTSSSISA